MKLNTNIFIVMGIIVFVCGQLESGGTSLEKAAVLGKVISRAAAIMVGEEWIKGNAKNLGEEEAKRILEGYKELKTLGSAGATIHTVRALEILREMEELSKFVVKRKTAEREKLRAEKEEIRAEKEEIRAEKEEIIDKMNKIKKVLRAKGNGIAVLFLPLVYTILNNPRELEDWLIQEWLFEEWLLGQERLID